MLHSVTNYPPLREPFYFAFFHFTDLDFTYLAKYSYPESGSKYAQSFLCLSLDANVLQDVGEYMRFAQVTPFKSNLPKFHQVLINDYRAPALQDVVKRKSLGRKNTVYTTIRNIQTLGGKKLAGF
ncbi:unnamed protein product [Strongylus vulgaris]|uniref:Uncharacterized protein n=1 Tax=Strongylus vulgaris TaxID=40348 RepID=A0A3P7JK87_STRVU|nr:unnamed protein product [Strongylus vulgaris]